MFRFFKGKLKTFVSLTLALLAAVLIPVEGLFLAAKTAYAASSPVTLELEVKIEFEDAGSLKETFTVNVEPQNGAPEPGQNQLSAELSMHKETDSLSFPITFANAGSYTYKVKQTVGTSPAVRYDGTVYDVIFDIDDSGPELRGVMKVKESDSSEAKAELITFVNKAVDNSIITADPPVRKIVSGTDKKDPFVFILKAENASNPMPSGASDGVKKVTVNGSGKVEFGTITFTKEGTYSYRVSEEKGTISGYTYDGSTYLIVYNVVKNGSALTCERTILKNDTEPAGECVFTNRYRNGQQDPSTTDTDKPDTPEKPDDPGKPITPEKPDTPSTPGTTPTTPTKPATPLSPTAPVDPEPVTVPEQTKTPADPDDPLTIASGLDSVQVSPTEPATPDNPLVIAGTPADQADNTESPSVLSAANREDTPGDAPSNGTASTITGSSGPESDTLGDARDSAGRRNANTGDRPMTRRYIIRLCVLSLLLIALIIVWRRKLNG